LGGSLATLNKIHSRSDGKHDIYFTSERDGMNLEITGASTKNVEDLVIIGHPIQLQHWLRVLATTKRGAMSTVGVLDGRVRDGLGMTPQSYYMTFNLTTGQPATEDDYKAFCEIVGVE